MDPSTLPASATLAWVLFPSNSSCSQTSASYRRRISPRSSLIMLPQKYQEQQSNKSFWRPASQPLGPLCKVLIAIKQGDLLKNVNPSSMGPLL